jgi:hypothetical protein
VLAMSGVVVSVLLVEGVAVSGRLSSGGVDGGVVACGVVGGGVVVRCVEFSEWWGSVVVGGCASGDVVGVVAIYCSLGGDGGGLVGGAMCARWTVGGVGCVEIWVRCFLLPSKFLK